MELYSIKKYQLTNGEELAYREAGQGNITLVLLHGNLTSSVHFHYLMQKLESKYRLIAVDMRGFGNSTYNQPIHSLRELADDILELLAGLNISTYMVLGWSTGGGVALEMAASQPSRIQKVFLLSSVGLKGLTLINPMTHTSSTMNLLGLPYGAGRTLMKWHPIIQHVENILSTHNKRQVQKMLAPLYAGESIPDEEMQLYREAAYQQQNYSDITYSLLTFNMSNEHNRFTEGSNRIELIEAPVTIIHGLTDNVVPVETAVETKAYLGDRATLYTITGGHSLLTDNLVQLVDIICMETEI